MANQISLREMNKGNQFRASAPYKSDKHLCSFRLVDPTSAQQLHQPSFIFWGYQLPSVTTDQPQAAKKTEAATKSWWTSGSNENFQNARTHPLPWACSLHSAFHLKKKEKKENPKMIRLLQRITYEARRKSFL